MDRLDMLYDMAEENGITVDAFHINTVPSMSLKDAEGDCYIAVDPMQLETRVQETERLAHEMGHCMTDSFYNERLPLFTRGRMERRANKWAVHRLVPLDTLIGVIERGYVEKWEIAEELSVTESMVNDAFRIYHSEISLA
jgi:hypothetical protein